MINVSTYVDEDKEDQLIIITCKPKYSVSILDAIQNLINEFIEEDKQLQEKKNN